MVACVVWFTLIRFDTPSRCVNRKDVLSGEIFGLADGVVSAVKCHGRVTPTVGRDARRSRSWRCEWAAIAALNRRSAVLPTPIGRGRWCDATRSGTKHSKVSPKDRFFPVPGRRPAAGN